MWKDLGMHNIRYCVVIVISAITSFHSLTGWTASPILERAVWNYWVEAFVVSGLLVWLGLRSWPS